MWSHAFCDWRKVCFPSLSHRLFHVQKKMMHSTLCTLFICLFTFSHSMHFQVYLLFVVWKRATEHFTNKRKWILLILLLFRTDDDDVVHLFVDIWLPLNLSLPFFRLVIRLPLQCFYAVTFSMFLKTFIIANSIEYTSEVHVGFFAIEIKMSPMISSSHNVELFSNFLSKLSLKMSNKVVKRRLILRCENNNCISIETNCWLSMNCVRVTFYNIPGQWNVIVCLWSIYALTLCAWWISTKLGFCIANAFDNHNGVISYFYDNRLVSSVGRP